MRHIILSPHYDDAALSCGGMIAQLVASGDLVEVATVFGGQPDPPTLSPFARSIHGRPGASNDLIAQRVAEEHQALGILGAQPRLGDYLDCIYRRDESSGRWLYDSEEALFGPVDRADDPLIDELAAVFAAVAPVADRCVIYAPLAAGSHVDHQVTRRAAEILHETGYTVYFYEDYPYIVRDLTSLKAALERTLPRSGWQSRLVPLSRQDLELKIAAVAAYASQLAVLFGADGIAARPAVASALDGFARHTAHEAESGRYAEKLWTAARKG